MNVYELKATTAEKIPVTITTSADPTATPPAFAITTSTTDPLTYHTGEWTGTWNPETGEIDALTPLAGNGQTLDVNPATDYLLYADWDVGTENPEKQCRGIVRVS